MRGVRARARDGCPGVPSSMGAAEVAAPPFFFAAFAMVTVPAAREEAASQRGVF